eukprot:SM000017S02764  [mRNA]  locus=s17:93306:94857:+ [translate_table: standard]
MQALGVDRGATAEQIRRAYHRLALRLHPDKNPGDAHVCLSPRRPPPPPLPPQAAKENFQSLQQVFAVLGDAERRRVYDQTGSLDDAVSACSQTELSGAAFDSLYEFYRNVFKKVSADDIVAFEADYRGSAEETADLKQLYRRFKGNMTMRASGAQSVPPMGSAGCQKRASSRVSTEAGCQKVKSHMQRLTVLLLRLYLELPHRDGNGGSQGDLAALIRSRQGQRGEELVAVLAAKYGKPEGNRVGKRRGGAEVAGGAAAHEPSEEDFAIAHKLVMARRGVAKPKK